MVLLGYVCKPLVVSLWLDVLLVGGPGSLHLDLDARSNLPLHHLYERHLTLIKSSSCIKQVYNIHCNLLHISAKGMWLYLVLLGLSYDHYCIGFYCKSMAL